MENINNEKINIFGVHIDKIDYGILLSRIYISISQNKKLTAAYANVNTLNLLYNNPKLKGILNSFDIVHPDGIGAYYASLFLYGKNGFRQRITGSDFYPLLIKESIKRNWRIYFLGHNIKTLEKIKPANQDLNIAGYTEGFNFDTPDIIEKVNNSRADILIAGLGFPGQEEWIKANENQLNCKVILAVGDGIKVFSKTKIRGPAVLGKIGLEWLVRLIINPRRYWKRYLIGNPVFLYRIIKLKLSKFAKA
jgi:N-acetylglucosaminyldiphosphoundecaprenol N-acetyl-beta-D-mannosaminyltransferase